ncbi:hypothetical protein [Paragemmobacter kunshanensis]|nr:hypothetical protein [Rhodobacter kunshanensis]
MITPSGYVALITRILYLSTPERGDMLLRIRGTDGTAALARRVSNGVFPAAKRSDLRFLWPRAHGHTSWSILSARLTPAGILVQFNSNLSE